jgi:hypothetical protein
VSPNVKRCATCEELKPLDCFAQLVASGNYRASCIECRGKKVAADAAKNYADVQRKRRENGLKRQNQIDPEIARRLRSHVEERRPCCPACGLRAPAQQDRDKDWPLAWGHRCPHREPCPAFSEPAPHVPRCTQCFANQPAQPSTEVRA